MTRKAKQIPVRCVWCGIDFTVSVNQIATRTLAMVCTPCQKEATAHLALTAVQAQQHLEQIVCAAVLSDPSYAHAFDHAPDAIWEEWLARAMGPALVHVVDGAPLALPDPPPPFVIDSIPAYCLAHGITRRALAKQIGVTDAVLGNLANGREVAAHHMRKIAAYTGIAPEALGQ